MSALAGLASLVVPLAAGVALDALAYRGIVAHHRWGASVAANAGAVLAIALAFPAIEAGWAALPGVVLDQPFHRWYARQKLAPWEGPALVAGLAITGAAAEWLVLTLGFRGRWGPRRVALVILSNTATLLTVAWWARWIAPSP